VKCIPKVSDIERICGNIKALAEAYFNPKGYIKKKLMETPGKNLHIDHVNYIEEMLLGIYKLLDSGISYNTWGYFNDNKITYGYLNEHKHTYEQMQKGLNYPAFIENEDNKQNKKGDV
jgi:hypothetical protein